MYVTCDIMYVKYYVMNVMCDIISVTYFYVMFDMCDAMSVLWLCHILFQNLSNEEQVVVIHARNVLTLAEKVR